MDNIKIFEINTDYINYLSPYAPHLFHNSKKGRSNTRKYIGIVFETNGFKYFAPLSSFKTKHKNMNEGLDFLKIKELAVINLNNMFPVPMSECRYIDFSTIDDCSYKMLLQSEYRVIKSKQERILKNAAILYKHKQVNGNETPLARRCNDFILLEQLCKIYENRGGH